MLAFPLFAVCLGTVAASGFAKPDKDEVNQLLMERLSGSADRSRVQQIQQTLESTFKSVPKTSGGGVGHQAMLYMMHRFAMEQHGWFIKDLDPTMNPSSRETPSWIPAYLEQVLEDRAGEQGLSLHEIAAMGATIEALIAAEAMRRFDMVTRTLNLPSLASLADFKEALSIFTLTVIRNERVPFDSAERLRAFFEQYVARSHGWPSLEGYVEETLKRYAKFTNDGLVDVTRSTDVFINLVLKYNQFNAEQCHGLKDSLVHVEGDMPGRVQLAQFYNRSFYGAWLFNEKPEYLKALGCLEETGGVQRVIIPNYIQAMNNCVKPSDLYSICCRSECEELLAHVEERIGAPSADVKTIIDMIAALPSETVPAPRSLPESLRGRLEDIASAHQGKVPLHGRLFAQWMHHVYPRECPYPHSTGTTVAVSPEEWMHQHGVSGSFESDDLKSFITNVSCSSNGDCNAPSATLSHELPWSDKEDSPLVCKEPNEPVKSVTKVANSKWYNSLPMAFLFFLVIVAAWHLLQPNNSGLWEIFKVGNNETADGQVHQKLIAVVAIFCLMTIAEPMYVACIMIPGFIALKVVPRIREEVFKRQKLRGLGTDYYNDEAHMA